MIDEDQRTYVQWAEEKHSLATIAADLLVQHRTAVDKDVGALLAELKVRQHSRAPTRTEPSAAPLDDGGTCQGGCIWSKERSCGAVYAKRREVAESEVLLHRVGVPRGAVHALAAYVGAHESADAFAFCGRQQTMMTTR